MIIVDSHPTHQKIDTAHEADIIGFALQFSLSELNVVTLETAADFGEVGGGTQVLQRCARRIESYMVGIRAMASWEPNMRDARK